MASYITVSRHDTCTLAINPVSSADSLKVYFENLKNNRKSHCAVTLNFKIHFVSPSLRVMHVTPTCTYMLPGFSPGIYEGIIIMANCKKAFVIIMWHALCVTNNTHNIYTLLSS